MLITVLIIERRDIIRRVKSGRSECFWLIRHLTLKLNSRMFLITRNLIDGEGQDNRKIAQVTVITLKQFMILLRRGLKERRHKSFEVLKIVQVTIISLFCGLLWWQSDTNHIQDQSGLLVFYTDVSGFFPLFQAIFTFPQEREMLTKERSSRMYKLSSYSVSRTIGDRSL